jgi:hypothetical protein
MHRSPNTTCVRFSLFAVVLAWHCVCTVVSIQAAEKARYVDGDAVSFTRDIQPLLIERCVKCHGGVRKEAGFSVISRELLLVPTENFDQPVVVPGDADRSELMRRITSADVNERMPPEGEPLSPEQISVLRRWIDAGADWPQHWAYKPIHARKWDRKRMTDPHPVDAIIRAKLNKFGITPSPPVDRRTLIRRLSLDITGLLPSVEQVEAFVCDRSDTAYEALVDRLLSSVAYGERWGRHWLDEARYADSEGFDNDEDKQDAYHYRDWVVRATNNDMPFNEFTIRQIAGDLLPGAGPGEKIATKLHLQAPFNFEGGVDVEEARTKRVIDRINTLASIWLGSTIGCCQCHDHPFDPLGQRDFYALYAFFNNTDISAEFLAEEPTNANELRQQRAAQMKQAEDLMQRQVTDKNLSADAQTALRNLRRFDNKRGFVRFLNSRTGNRRSTYIFERGDFLRPRIDEGVVSPATPGVLPSLRPRGLTADRLDLARWLVSKDNPLTARVTVNKIWTHLLGRPLAEQPANFGASGSRPIQLELLDWLAYWFVERGDWSRKTLIRLIVTSDTYRQSSVVRLDLAELDPDNRLFARQNAFRVEAETVRDITLQTAGLLSRKLGGPGVFPPLPDVIIRSSYVLRGKYSISTGEDRYRRALYTFSRRSALDPIMTTFDCSDATLSTPMRSNSNNALQALTSLNNEIFFEASQAFAKRILHETQPSSTDRERLTRAFRIALGRDPRGEEMAPLEDVVSAARDTYTKRPADATRLIADFPAEGVDVHENAAWVVAARIVLNLDEFVTRD